jgi:two-component system response regulator YesN
MLTFFLVEDDLETANRYKAIIENYNPCFKVIGIETEYRRSKEMILTNQPDVVISDIQIQGGLGTKMLIEVRQAGWNGTVVIISGHSVFDYARNALQVSAIEYLLKPVFVEDFHQVLENLSHKLKFEFISPDSEIEEKEKKPEFIIRALDYIYEMYQKDISLHDIAEKAFVSEPYLSSSFHKYCGSTVIEFLNNYRIWQAKKLLITTDEPIKEIATSVGIKDPSYFYRCFKKLTGKTPAQYRQKIE